VYVFVSRNFQYCLFFHLRPVFTTTVWGFIIASGLKWCVSTRKTFRGLLTSTSTLDVMALVTSFMASKLPLRWLIFCVLYIRRGNRSDWH
jgi:hypothetical protein